MKRVRFGNISIIILGQSPPSSTYNTNGIGLPFFQGKAEFTDLYPNPRKWCSKPKKIAEPNDILVSVRAPVGATNIANQRCCIGRGLAAIRYPECPKYIFYYLRLIENELDKLGTGSTFKAISGNTLKNLEIPLPPLPTQHRIVEKIEELFSELDSGVEALKKAKEQIGLYKQSVLKAAFSGKLLWGQRSEVADQRSAILKAAEPRVMYGVGDLPEGWKWMKVGEVTHINPKLPFEKLNEETAVSFLPMRCVGELTGKYDLKEERRYSKVRKGYTPFTDGDVIFAKITPCMENGKIAVVENLKNKIGFGSTEFHVFRCKSNLSNYYLFYFFLQDSFRARAQRSMTGAVGQKRVPKIFMEKSEIPLPPLDQQHQIVAEIERRFSEAENLEKSIDEGLAKAEALRQSILKQAFEGRLVEE